MFGLRWDTGPFHVAQGPVPLKWGGFRNANRTITIIGYWAFIGVYQWMDHVDGDITIILPGGDPYSWHDRFPLYAVHKYGVNVYRPSKHVFFPDAHPLIYKPGQDIIFLGSGAYGGVARADADYHFMVHLLCK